MNNELIKIDFFCGSDGQSMAFRQRRNAGNNGESSLPFLILVHGLGSDSNSWIRQFDFLHDAGYSIAAFDLRGHGKSDGSKDYEYYSMENAAKDIDCLVKHLDCEKNFVLIGHCYGGAIVQVYQRLFPNKPKAYFILSSTSDNRNSGVSRLCRLYFRYTPTRLFYRRDRRNRKYRTPHYNRNYWDWSVFRIVEGILHTTALGYAAAMSHFHKFHEAPTLKSYEVPVVVVVGKYDSVFPADESRYVAGKVKNCTLCLMPAANHVITHNNPDDVNQTLLSGLRDLHLA